MRCDTLLAFMADPVVRSGGPRRYFRHLAMLADQDTEVVVLVNQHILTAPAFREARLQEHPNIRVNVITNRLTRPRGGWALFFWRVVRQRWQEIELYRPDVIFVYGSCNLLAAAALKRICSARCVFDPRDNPVIEWGLIARQTQSIPKRALCRARQAKERCFERLMRRIVDGYFFQTDVDALQYQKRIGFPDSAYAVLPNSVAGLADPHTPPPSPPSPSPPPSLRTILFCGSLTPLKGAMFLVRALHFLTQDAPAQRLDLRLQIAGDGPDEPALRSYIDTHALPATLLGRIPSCRSLMASSDLLVVPSLYDALPDVLLEAFSAGIAVIGSDVAGIRVAINDPRFLFPPASPAAIAEKIRTLLAPDSLHAAAEHSRQQHRRYDFDWAERFMRHIAALP